MEESGVTVATCYKLYFSIEAENAQAAADLCARLRSIFKEAVERGKGE